jgi:FHS family Na+ dependent glucose MFS transporter 1
MFLKEQNRKKWAIPITIGYFLTFVCFGFAGSAVGPLINRLSESTSANIFSSLSYLFLFRSFGFIGSSLLLARLFDRFPGNRLLSFGLLFLGAMLALLGSTSVLWQLFLIMFILGISANFVNMGGNTLIQWLHKDNAGPFLNLVHVFYSIGCIITPLLIGSSLNSGQPIGRTLLILGFVVLPVALFLVFLPSPEIPVQRTDKNVDQAQSETHIGK